MADECIRWRKGWNSVVLPCGRSYQTMSRVTMWTVRSCRSRWGEVFFRFWLHLIMSVTVLMPKQWHLTEWCDCQFNFLTFNIQSRCAYQCFLHLWIPWYSGWKESWRWDVKWADAVLCAGTEASHGKGWRSPAERNWSWVNAHASARPAIWRPGFLQGFSYYILSFEYI